MQRIFPISSATCQMGSQIPAEGFPSNKSIFREENYLEGTVLVLVVQFCYETEAYVLGCMSMCDVTAIMHFPSGNKRR